MNGVADAREDFSFGLSGEEILEVQDRPHGLDGVGEDSLFVRLAQNHCIHRCV